MTPETFKRWRDSLGKELIATHTCYSIWEQLWPSQEAVEVLNRFQVFFHYTRAAHMQLFFLRVAKVTEYRQDSINLWRLLDEVEKEPNLAPGISISEVRQQRRRLEDHSDLLKRIRRYRNKRIAHIDERQWQDSVVTHGEAKELLQDLEDVFNKLSVAHDRGGWHFEPSRMQDTSELLEELSHK